MKVDLTEMKRLLQFSLFLLACVSAVAQTGTPAAEPAAPYGGPAYRAAKLFLRGANFANFLEVPPGENWAVRHTVADLKAVRAEGFDHVRLPVGWHHYCGPGPEFQISDEIFGKVDDMVTNAISLGLNIIINIHHFNEFTSNPPAYTDQFCAIWRQVAAHYAAAPPGVAFELLNEPKDAATTVVMNPIYARAIAVIRQSNPGRTIFAGPGRWNSPRELVNFQLPENDDNIIVTLHCYEPFHFTHQGANWAGPDEKVTGIQFPGPPRKPLVPDPALHLSEGTVNWIHKYNSLPEDRNPSSNEAFRGLVDQAIAWSRHFKRPIHFGEFGAYTGADQQSRARYYAAFRHAMDEARMGWAIWDWKSGFNYWDPNAGEPLPGMRRALFPKSAGAGQ